VLTPEQHRRFDMFQYLGLGSVGVAVVAGLRWAWWLRFCRWYITKTGTAEGLEKLK
jgi:hypothetical protein